MSANREERFVKAYLVKLAEGLAYSLTESDWKKFSTLHDLDEYITEHPRFLRSKRWDDDDHEGLVLDLVIDLYESDPAAVRELSEMPSVEQWLGRNAKDEFILFWEDPEPDPLLIAVSQGFEEVDVVKGVVDLSEHTNRIRDALPGDPSQAIGATKDMLESTMKTILDDRGVQGLDKLKFPALTAKCFAELGLSSATPPSDPLESHRRKIASSAKNIVEAANQLRNKAGAGHGRVVGKNPTPDVADASLVASVGLVVAAWLLRHADDN